MLDEREFELINIIGAQLGSNQRDLSRHLSLSLGMTNMLLRRLVAKGYIRIKQLNKKKAEYLLTSKGFTEKSRKSVNYTLKTIRSIGLIKERLELLVRSLKDAGHLSFWVLGESDLVVLVEMVLHSCGIAENKIIRIKELPKEPIEGMVLICREHVAVPPGIKHINLIEDLAKDAQLLAHNIHHVA